jgi:SPP1 family predicted phage head-tail adaptor
MSLSARLNKRVTIQKAGAGQDALGQPVKGWTNLVTAGDGKVWAEVKDVNGRQYVAAQAGQNAVQTQITIRSREGVLPTMRVLYGSNIYDIEAVLEADSRTLALMCVKGANDG